MIVPPEPPALPTPIILALPFHDQYTPPLLVCGSSITCASLWPASAWETLG